ncbi:MAG TPA: hypothetical protein V6C46_10435 [Coleofasciculaceae cyanobacterium]
MAIANEDVKFLPLKDAIEFGFECSDQDGEKCIYAKMSDEGMWAFDCPALIAESDELEDLEDGSEFFANVFYIKIWREDRLSSPALCSVEALIDEFNF